MKSGIPPQRELIDILFNENSCFLFLLEKKILYTERICPKCGSNMNLQQIRRCFRCTKKTCRKQISVFAGSFFSKCKTSCEKIMNIGYHWISGATYTELLSICGHSTGTIVAFIKYFKELVANNVNEESCIIGGQGIVVEMDESKLAKRKHNRGHRVTGVWVIGGVERTEQRNMFVCIVQNRNAETIKDLVYRHVHTGSKIFTDYWKGYDWLDEDANYSHEKVNHSLHFKDPETAVHTNTIEGTWSGIKRCIPSRTRTKSSIGDSLFCFIWKRQNIGRLWDSFVEALSDYLELEDENI